VKVFDFRRIRSDIKPSVLANSFTEEVRMAYRLRGSQSHVVTIYGFDFDGPRRVALVAMELGDDSLIERIVHLHQLRSKHLGKRIHDHDYISATDRKNIWVQFVGIIMTLQKLNIVIFNFKLTSKD
jgi:hypothetical protein